MAASLSQQLAELKAENERLMALVAAKTKSTEITVDVTESGQFSVSGIKKGPPSVFTKAQFERLLAKAADILSYMDANAEKAAEAAKVWVPKPRKVKDAVGAEQVAA